MRIIILSIALLFCAFSAQSQVLKSAGVWYFLDVDSMTARPAVLPNGTELAYVIGTRTLYKWNRGSSAWEVNSSGGLTMPFDSIYFTPSNVAPDTAELKYSSDYETFVFGADGTTIEIGQKEAWYVKNQTGSTINKGTVVRASGTLGSSGRILISPMVIDGTVSSKYLLGIAASNIANGADGYVIDFGKLRKFNTAAWADGAALYAGAGGTLTATEPSPPNLRLPIAFVVHSHATNGILAIRIQTGNELHELHDVDTTGINTGEGLVYNSTLHKWQASAGKAITTADTTSLLATKYWTNSNFFPLQGGTLTGTGGAGFIGLPSQVTAPGTPASGLNIYAQGSSFNWKGTDGFERLFASNLTGGRTYTLPDVSGTFALGTGTADRSARWGATNTLAAGNMTDNGAKLESLLPHQLANYTTATLPTGVKRYMLWDDTKLGIGWYNGTRWAYGVESTIATGTSGSIPFIDANGQLTQDNANLSWLSSTMLLRGTTPTLRIRSNLSGDAMKIVFGNSSATDYNSIESNTTSDFLSIKGWSGSGLVDRIYISNATGNRGSIGMGTTSPSSKAVLELSSTEKGILIPRMTTTERNLITSPPNLLLIGNTTTSSLEIYDILTSSWRSVSGWQNFSGGLYYNSGTIGIGTASPNTSYNFHVNGASLLGGNTTILGTSPIFLIQSATTSQLSKMNFSNGTQLAGFELDPVFDQFSLMGFNGSGLSKRLTLSCAGATQGFIGVNQALPKYIFDISSTNALGLPRGAVSTRPTISSSTTPFRFDTDSTALEYGESAGVWRLLATRSYARSLVSGLSITWLKTELEAGRNVNINAGSTFLKIKQGTNNFWKIKNGDQIYQNASDGLSIVPYTDSNYVRSSATILIGGNHLTGKASDYSTIITQYGTSYGNNTGSYYFNTLVGYDSHTDSTIWNTVIGAKNNSNKTTRVIIAGNSNTVSGNFSGAFGYQNTISLANRYQYGNGTDDKFIRHFFYGNLAVGADSSFWYNNTTKNLSLKSYGTGTKEAADLSKTESVYNAIYATDGTLLEKRANTEQYNTVTSTTSPVTLSSTIADNLINQGGTQATFTLNMPASPVDGQVVMITYNNAITTLTIDGNGNTIVGSAVTTAVAGSQRKFKFYTGIGWIKQY